MPAASRTLDSLQTYLTRLYELDVVFRVEDFLLTDESVARALEGARFRAIDEKLLVRQDGEHLDISLYLEPALLARLEAARPMQSLGETALEDFWAALEGVSHFLYLVHNAQHDRGVRGVELELQAEVDKFVVTALLAEEQRTPAERRVLHHVLFERMQPDAGLELGLRRRYEEASRRAAGYCRGLIRRFREGGRADLLRELRRFYRLDHAAKLRFIETRA